MLLRHARRLVILVVGGTLLLGGVLLIVLPGPAFVVIPLGLAILATEFEWARRMLKKARSTANNTAARFAWRRPVPPPATDPAARPLE